MIGTSKNAFLGEVSALLLLSPTFSSAKVRLLLKDMFSFSEVTRPSAGVVLGKLLTVKKKLKAAKKAG